LASVSYAPAAVNPSGHRATSSATASARSEGVVSAVGSANVWGSGGGGGGAAWHVWGRGVGGGGGSPGKSGSGATTVAISSALSAARSAPSGEKSFVAVTPRRPSDTTPPRIPAPSRCGL